MPARRAGRGWCRLPISAHALPGTRSRGLALGFLVRDSEARLGPGFPGCEVSWEEPRGMSYPPWKAVRQASGRGSSARFSHSFPSVTER